MKDSSSRGVIAFLILAFLGILVSLFAIGFFTEQHPFGFKNFNYKNILHLECGLTVYAPKKDANVAFPYKVYGYANGCDWEPGTDGSLGTVTVLAANGLILERAEAQVANLKDGKPYYFEAILDPSLSFYEDAGTIIIENRLPGFQHKTITIPVHFTSNL